MQRVRTRGLLIVNESISFFLNIFLTFYTRNIFKTTCKIYQDDLYLKALFALNVFVCGNVKHQEGVLWQQVILNVCIIKNSPAMIKEKRKRRPYVWIDPNAWSPCCGEISWKILLVCFLQFKYLTYYNSDPPYKRCGGIKLFSGSRTFSTLRFHFLIKRTFRGNFKKGMFYM